MATTNSTDKNLNHYLGDHIESNSGINEFVYTNTGNMNRKKGLPVLNSTYTCSSSGNAVINAKLLNYSDAILKFGNEISSGLVQDQVYEVIGHPDKWVYDYIQDYSNCGVDSALNVLSIAGKQDIIQVDTEYQTYLDTPVVETKMEWVITDEETLAGEWKEITKETYPVQATNTEDAFLLWAVKNSFNDKKWYDDSHLSVGDVDVPSGIEIKDFCLHSKNVEAYQTIKDLGETREEKLEIGGTSVLHRDNILEAFGVEAEYENFKIKQVAQVGADITDIGEPVTEDWGDGKKVTTVTKVTSSNYMTVTTTTEVIYYEDAEMQNKSHTIKTVVVENQLNSAWYNFVDKYEELVREGKGIILAGDATANYEGEPGTGAGHAITLTGLVKGDVVVKETNVYIDDELQGNQSTSEMAKDVVGFYVMDTGGWLGYNEGSAYVTVRQLYNFLTNGYTVGHPSEEVFTDGYINYTKDNIKDWAFKLDLKGNNRKNILKGNDSANRIYAGNGNDVLYGYAGNDELYGENNNDTILGGQGDDLLVGGNGNDTYIFRAGDRGGNDTIIAGSGLDKIQFDNGIVLTEGGYEKHTIQPIMDVVDETTGNIITEGMKYQNINGDLVIEYTSKIEKLDSLLNPTGEIEEFNNTLTIKDYFKKQLFKSIQYITEAEGKYVEGEDINYGNFEYNSYKFFDDFILNKGFIDYYVYTDKDNKINGTKYRDSIIGGDRNDSLSGASGNDVINGGYGDDTIKGGNGDDQIYASYGNDKIYGDAGNDIFYYNGKDYHGNTITFGGDDTIYAGSGSDYIYMDNLERSQLLFTKQGSNLVITYNQTTGDTITIANYFSRKGNMSIKGIQLKNNDTLDFRYEYQSILNATNANPALVINDSRNTADATLTGGISHDKITAGKGNDLINGGIGFDTLYGGNGNDTLIGGGDADKMYGQAGDNTYKFNLADGHDTIYTAGKGTTILDFTGTGLTFDEGLVTGFLNDHIYTKVKNDLLINYALTKEQDGNATVQISNYFSSANNFTLKWGDAANQSINLKDAYIYMNGDDLKKNTITGSKYNDSIVGYDFDDVLKGGAGNDIIEAGKGNDKITGGTGNNVIRYTKGDGNDTIYLTRNENLTIELDGFTGVSNINTLLEKFYFDIVKNDLVINEVTVKDGVGILTPFMTIKSFGKSDVTGVKGSVFLDVNGVRLDLREGDYLSTYTSFTNKKYSYSGNWHSEVIDARKLDDALTRGIRVNANSGHDTIYGSIYNDVINGGNGDDVIYTDYGKNTANGGNGNDTYHVFKFEKKYTNINETTTIKDSGKTYEKSGEIDKVIVDAKKSDIVYTTGDPTNSSSIWFNITNKGKATYTLNIRDNEGNTAKVTGVEKVITTEGTASTADDKQFNFYNNNQLINDVVNWLNGGGTLGNSYKDVSTALSKGAANDAKELLAIFAKDDYWGAVTDTI